MWQVRTFLSPSDFSEPSAEAYQTACEIARELQARIVFLHMAEKPVVSYIQRGRPDFGLRKGSTDEKCI